MAVSEQLHYVFLVFCFVLFSFSCGVFFFISFFLIKMSLSQPMNFLMLALLISFLPARSEVEGGEE